MSELSGVKEEKERVRLSSNKEWLVIHTEEGIFRLSHEDAKELGHAIVMKYGHSEVL